ncbi:MAG: serine protease [Actinomycetota bacterium]|nr:serine protease [Actinomycetota bacterium]
MATGGRKQLYPPRAPVRRPASTRPASTRPSFDWRGYFSPRSTLGAVMLVTAIAVVVSFVATLIYATVDAGRPIESGPTTVPGGPTETTPTVVITEPQTSTTRLPENLPPEALRDKLAASVRTVKTLTEDGQPIEGSAFVVGSFGGQTLLLTSFALVRAGTRAPAPPITLGDNNRSATLWTWQEARDLALLVIPGNVESLPWANAEAAPKAGERIFTIKDGRLVTGVVLATSSSGIEHNIFTDDKLQGAPLVNQKGEVLAMASRAYNPDGKGTETLYVGVPISFACDQVLRCGSGNTTASSTAPPPSTPPAGR